MRIQMGLWSGLLAIAMGFALPQVAQAQENQAPPSYTEPPELTTVTASLILPDGSAADGGLVYFVFQRRLLEIPREGSAEKIKALSEKAAAVDKDGSITLSLKPGNFAMFYDPEADSSTVPGPGPESMDGYFEAKRTKESLDARIAAIKENATNGLPIEEGTLGEMYVVENRFVRPPLTDFGEIVLGGGDVVNVVAKLESGEAPDFPLALRLRGKNGEIYEPHSPTAERRNVHAFHDVFPQEYQVYALGTRPAPGQGDEITTPTVTNNTLVFTGGILDHDIEVKPGTPGGDEEDDTEVPAPTSAAPQ